jgi:hypothetical protein
MWINRRHFIGGILRRDKSLGGGRDAAAERLLLWAQSRDMSDRR